MGTRRVYLAGCTRHPNSAWVTQQARQLTWQLQEQDSPMRFLFHDRDTKFSGSFEAVFAAEGIETVLTPYRAPNANAIAERWVRSVRNECLDQILIANETHLHRVLTEYIGYYNAARPHQGLVPFPFREDQSTVKFTATTSWVASFMITVVRPRNALCRTADRIFEYYAPTQVRDAVRCGVASARCGD